RPRDFSTPRRRYCDATMPSWRSGRNDRLRRTRRKTEIRAAKYLSSLLRLRHLGATPRKLLRVEERMTAVEVRSQRTQIQLPRVRLVLSVRHLHAQQVASPRKIEQVGAEHSVGSAGAGADAFQHGAVLLRRLPHEVSGHVAQGLAHHDQQADAALFEFLFHL